MRRYILELGSVLLLFPLSVCCSTHYVWCGATGGATGADFTNAFTALPSALVRGDTYVVAGSASCTYGNHVFDDVESGTSVITVRKAEASLDSAVAGWQSSFATAQAEWTVPRNTDPESTSNISPSWAVCRSYYTIDGITGISDPAAGGPSGFGFLLQSANTHFDGLANIGTNSCGAGTAVTLSNITISHTEMNGVDRYLPATVNSCSYAGTTVTATTAATTYSWVVGDTISGEDSSNSLLFRSPTAIATVSGQTITFTDSSNPCLTLANIALDYSAPIGFEVLFLTDTFSNIAITHNYVHDMGGSLCSTQNTNNSTFSYNYFARNRNTAANHAAGCDDHTGSDSDTWSYNYWTDIQGTAFQEVLNSGTVGTSSNWNIFGNVFWETNPASNSIGGGVIQCINGNTCSNWKIFNNTFYNITSPGSGRIGWTASSTSSTGILVYDNLWAASGNVQPNVSSGSICYDETAACASTAQLVSDYNFYDTNNTGTTPSDVHKATATVSPATFWINSASSDFRLAADGANLFNTDVLLHANTTDFFGNTRGADGTWEPGAFEFQATASRGGLELMSSDHP